MLSYPCNGCLGILRASKSFRCVRLHLVKSANYEVRGDCLFFNGIANNYGFNLDGSAASLSRRLSNSSILMKVTHLFLTKRVRLPRGKSKRPNLQRDSRSLGKCLGHGIRSYINTSISNLSIRSYGLCATRSL